MDGTRRDFGALADIRRLAMSRRALLQRAVVIGGGAALARTVGVGAQDGEENPRHFGKTIEPAEHEGGLLIEGGPLEGGAFTSVNPVLDIYQPVVGLVFERLLDLNVDTFEPVPNLAESWTVSEDGLAWAFVLRQGVLWHDGQPLTPEDVKFSWDSHMNEATGAPEVSFITEVIDRVEVGEGGTVVFHIKSPSSDFPADYVQWYPILPKHIWEPVPVEEWIGHPGSDGSDPSFVIGTGPFKFVEWVQGSDVTLDRFDDYWDGRPHLDQYKLKIVEDSNVIVGLLQTGEVDFAVSVDPAVLASLDLDNFSVYTQWNGRMSVMELNHKPERTPLFTDQRVRQAMAWAMDRESTIEAADFGYGAVPLAFLLPGFWALNEEGITHRYQHDPERAMQLLDEAGWTAGSDGVREKDGQRFSFTLHMRAGNTREATRMQIIQENLRAVGIDVTIEFEDQTAFLDRRSREDYDAIGFELYIGPTPEHSFIWSCGNTPGFCDPRIDELYDAGRAETDRARRVEIYTEIQNLLMEELPSIPIANRELVYVANKRAHNLFEITESDAHFNAETWWVDE